MRARACVCQGNQFNHAQTARLNIPTLLPLLQTISCVCVCVCVCVHARMCLSSFLPGLPVEPIWPQWRPRVGSLPISASLRHRPEVRPCVACRPVRYALEART